MNKLFIFIPFFFFCSFREPVYCKFSNSIVRKYTKELKEDKNLFLIAKGGAMMHDIKGVTVDYLSLEPFTTIEQARNLYVEVAEEYLNRYNADEKVRPFLHNYPFTIQNLKMQISFLDSNRQRPEKGKVALVFSARDKLFFSTYDHEKDDLVDLHEEPYEEAVRIVKNSFSSKK